MRGFRALDDVVVVERDAPETFTAGGLVLPATAQEELDQGTVVAIGPGKRSSKASYLPLDVREGDRVLFSKYANLAMKLNGRDYVTMREADLVGVIEG